MPRGIIFSGAQIQFRGFLARSEIHEADRIVFKICGEKLCARRIHGNPRNHRLDVDAETLCVSQADRRRNFLPCSSVALEYVDRVVHAPGNVERTAIRPPCHAEVGVRHAENLRLARRALRDVVDEDVFIGRGAIPLPGLVIQAVIAAGKNKQRAPIRTR